MRRGLLKDVGAVQAFGRVTDQTLPAPRYTSFHVERPVSLLSCPWSTL